MYIFKTSLNLRCYLSLLMQLTYDCENAPVNGEYYYYLEKLFTF